MWISSDEFGIGRHPNNDLHITDGRLSAYHCRIERVISPSTGEISIYLYDCSTNGTYRNDELVSITLSRWLDKTNIRFILLISRSVKEIEWIFKMETRSIFWRRITELGSVSQRKLVWSSSSRIQLSKSLKNRPWRMSKRSLSRLWWISSGKTVRLTAEDRGPCQSRKLKIRKLRSRFKVLPK